MKFFNLFKRERKIEKEIYNVIEYIDDAYREVDEQLDYEYILSCMSIIDWKYYGVDVMSVKELKKMCHKLIKAAFINKCDAACGGFYVKYRNAVDAALEFGYTNKDMPKNIRPNVSVYFVVDSAESNFEK